MPNVKAASAGLFIMALAFVAFSGAIGLPGGTPQHVGPGAAPSILAVILFILGIIIAVEGLVRGRLDGDR